MRQLSQQEISHISGGASSKPSAFSGLLGGLWQAVVQFPTAFIDPFYYFGSLAGVLGLLKG